MTGLTDRMRTCAAFIMGRPNDAPMPTEHLLDDAAALLLAAADEIDVLTGPIEMGEPMEIIEPPPPGFAIDRTPSATWVAPGGQLPLEWARHRSKTACPKCDSRTQKKVYRTIDRTAMLVCPVCAHEWQYQR